MTPTPYLSESISSDAVARRCSSVRTALVTAGVFAPDAEQGPQRGKRPAAATRWRIAPDPFFLSAEQERFFRSLGPQLFAFYRALNRLYGESLRGLQPAWVARYLDQGKPDSLLAVSRMKRFREALPAVIRPDIIPTQDGMAITELDSVPGGIGLTACMSQAYGDLPDSSSLPSTAGRQPWELVGGRDGMAQGFAAMLQAEQGKRPGCVALVVSDEAEDYRAEMTWLAAQLRTVGTETYCVHPRDVRFTEDGLWLAAGAEERPIGLVYRFFELFDLVNIPKAELIMYAAKKGRVAITPPYKPAMEEKLAFALLHHPMLRPFWRQELGDAVFGSLEALMPRTWVLDPAPVPPAATIPDLFLGDRAVSDWRDLAAAKQKERHYVIKPSGFSELAWGSRGVSVGHDMPQHEWSAAIEAALASFPSTPYVLQVFHKGRLFESSYCDAPAGEAVSMSGRVRLSPYYFVIGDKVELAGILATICPADKKVLHGMVDAIMAPCAVRRRALTNGE